MKKSIAAGIAAFALASAFALGTVADDITQEITALICPHYTVILDGEVQSFTDANGASVYPINYNGTTYLPIRALSGAFGADVAWDGATNTITLTTQIQSYPGSTMTYARVKELTGVAAFWAPTGNKVHQSPFCSSFKGGAVFAGTVDQASTVRTGGWCGVCGSFTDTNRYALPSILESCLTYEDYVAAHPGDN